MNRRAPSSSGFTLIEIMLVVIIIGVLAAMVVPRFAGRTTDAKIARAKSDIAAIGLALDLCELDIGVYPSTLTELVAKEAPTDFSDEARAAWKGPYLKKGMPRDPWGRAYAYERAADGYTLSSPGPDGQPSQDDITSWE